MTSMIGDITEIEDRTGCEHAFQEIAHRPDGVPFHSPMREQAVRWCHKCGALWIGYEDGSDFHIYQPGSVSRCSHPGLSQEAFVEGVAESLVEG